MQPSHSVSVVIPTFNGAHKLARSISGLAVQTINPTEIVIVVDGSSDNTLEVLESLSNNYNHLAIRVICQPNSGRSGAKNRGISEALSDLLVFMDDDREPVPEWLENHIKHHQSVSGSVATGSLLAPPYYEQFEIRRYQKWLHNQWDPSVHCTNDNRLTIPYINAGNFSVHKSTLARLGCFRQGINDCEDRVLALAAMESSTSIFFLPAAQCVDHDTHSSTFIGMGIRALEYEKGRLRLVELDSSYLNYAPFQPFRPPLAKLLIYKFLSHHLFLMLADYGLFRVLPYRIRYQVYNVLITAFSRFSQSA